MRNLKEKTMESLSAVLPITMIVLVLSVLLVPMDTGAALMFMAGAVMLVVGMGLFQLGAETAMMPMGEGVGVQVSKTRSLIAIVAITFFTGLIVTVAEPDLQVLATQVPSIPNAVLVWTVAAGVGFFLVVAILRILLQVPLRALLLGSYLLLFAISPFVPRDFLSVAFDAGGVTTGPITVPFIMAVGVGIASIRSDKTAAEDSFGLVALCSAGPILAVMLLGIFYHPTDATYTRVEMPLVATTRSVVAAFFAAAPSILHEVLVALLPILAVFALLQMVSRRYTKRQITKMVIGFAYTIAGLLLFLTGVSVGFMPVGHILGAGLAKGTWPWLLVPLGMLIGYFIVKAEPAVQVLNQQVEEITEGAIAKSSMNACLSIGMSISVGLAMVRVLTGLSIYWILIPGYLLALVLMLFVPKIFVGIAFDSGGVCSGPMTSTFLLPLAMGASEAIGGNIMTDAFGAVAMVAMTPLIAVQLMGVLYLIKESRAQAQQPAYTTAFADEGIVDYEEDV